MQAGAHYWVVDLPRTENDPRFDDDAPQLALLPLLLADTPMLSDAPESVKIYIYVSVNHTTKSNLTEYTHFSHTLLIGFS